MQRGEIWLIDLDAEDTQGRETYGRRPVFVVTTKLFNETTRLAWVCPITGGAAGTRGGELTVPLATSGTKTDGVILCYGLRAIDWKARNGKKWEKVPDFITEQVLGCIGDILDDE